MEFRRAPNRTNGGGRREGDRVKLKADQEKAKELLAAAEGVPGVIDTLRAALGRRVGEAILREQTGVTPPPYEIGEPDPAKAKELFQWLSAQTPDPKENRYIGRAGEVGAGCASAHARA